jgi:hypothetical protein
MVVDGPGNELLARSGLARDENAGSCGRDAGDQIEQMIHRL